MQKDKLEKYETAPSALPRQTNRSLARLPKPKRMWVKFALALLVMTIVVAGAYILWHVWRTQG